MIIYNNNDNTNNNKQLYITVNTLKPFSVNNYPPFFYGSYYANICIEMNLIYFIIKRYSKQTECAMKWK